MRSLGLRLALPRPVSFFCGKGTGFSVSLGLGGAMVEEERPFGRQSYDRIP
jgi:hypothetical protein